MPRSPNDATRFTSTGPYVSTKPSSGFSFNAGAAPATSRSQIDFGTAPAGETAEQKITRLRAAAQAAKRGNESGFDKTVRIGRIWADRAHRVTAYGLLGLTVVSAAVATAGITDMLLHNRRRRNEWLAEKKAETARDIAIAKMAEARGNATEDQILLLNRERAAEEAAEAKRNRPGVFKRLFSGSSTEEQKGGQVAATAASAEKSVSEFTSDAVEGVKSKLQAAETTIDSNRRQGERVQELFTPSGGPLDREADLAITAASSKAKSWTSWITGR